MFSASRNSLAVFILLRMQLHVSAWGFMVYGILPDLQYTAAQTSEELEKKPVLTVLKGEQFTCPP